MWRKRLNTLIHFNPLPPCGGRLSLAVCSCKPHNFNPLPPCGGRRCEVLHQLEQVDFNPLPPCGGRRQCDLALIGLDDDFNPLPPCGGRHRADDNAVQPLGISIHSLRVEGDPLSGIVQLHGLFQSTPSVWRETALPKNQKRDAGFQSTPSVWRETMSLPPYTSSQRFQSTPSVWRETAKLHSFPLKTQQSKCNFDKKEHRCTFPCQKKYFFSDFFTKKRVRIPHAFSVRLGFAPKRFLRTKAVPPHRWFPLHRYVPLSSDTDSPDSRTGGYPSRYRWHPSAAV